MNITISVTQNDINNGIQIECQKCPIARAINRRLKSKFIAEIFAWRVDLYNTENHNKRLYEVEHNQEAFIVAFDRGKKVKPFRFRRDICCPYKRMRKLLIYPPTRPREY